MTFDINTGVGQVADLAKTVIARIWPDKSAQEQAELAAALVIVQGQIDIDKAEAGSTSIFVAGWRPFIGWVCGMACAWNWIGISAFTFALAAAGHAPLAFSRADVTEMMPLLLGMLGLGAMRTIEKIKGAA